MRYFNAYSIDLEPFLKKRKKEMRNLKDPSLGITVCHHSALLVMPKSYPRDGLFDPILTLMIDSYNLMPSYR